MIVLHPALDQRMGIQNIARALLPEIRVRHHRIEVATLRRSDLANGVKIHESCAPPAGFSIRDHRQLTAAACRYRTQRPNNRLRGAV